jgi:prefoldin subunit 5
MTIEQLIDDCAEKGESFLEALSNLKEQADKLETVIKNLNHDLKKTNRKA